MGAGDDTFVWDPGDGSDTVEGQAGADAMVFNGAGGPERVALSPNGSRLRFLREPGTITMDTAGVERVDFNALGGADVITVDDLTGTDVSAVNLDVGVDNQADHVTVNGTDRDDRIDVAGDASGVAVSGLRALVSVRDQESTDQLLVDGRGGNDTISAAALAAGAIGLTIAGGAGDDTLAGAKGVETLLGGDGNDSADGNGGNDRAELGAGDDTFVWDPGDGSDTVEGQDGADTMLFNGAGGDEQVDLSANGSRLRFFRNPGTITMDTAGIERVDFIALGGADDITINDLAGTDVHSVNVDLAGTPGGNAGDNKPDRVLVNGTDDDDAITVRGDANSVNVKGLAPAIGILHAQAVNDTLEIDTLAGHDSVDPAGLAAGAIKLVVNGALVS
jgi:Ca2+-binding RTX toxin-like protein